MGLFDKIFGNRPKPEGEYKGWYEMMTGYQPHFSTWGGSIYESELVRASINAIATHCSKLQVTIGGSAKPRLQTRLRHGPNEYQTWGQFLALLATRLYVHNTAYIVPVFDDYGEPSGVYSVLPEWCELVQYGDQPYLRFKFSWGDWAAVELEKCGIMTRFQYRDDLAGESNRALIPTMDLIKIQNQGIQEGVKSAATYRFMAQANNFANADDLKIERMRFTARNFSREAEGGGLLLFPNTYTNIKQIDVKPYVVDANQMSIINKSVYEYFGVNEDVLTNKAYGDAWAAFYEGVIEPFAIQFSEVMSKMLFTLRERSQGAFVMATSNRLQYMTNADKLAVSAQMADRGILNRDEVREIWNLPPLPNGEGQAYIIRGEYYDATEKLEGANEA